MPSITLPRFSDNQRNTSPSLPAKRTQPPNLSSGVPDSSVRASEAEKAAADSQLWATIRKRKFKARAFGITVLVAACAILGAQLKSVKQETDKVRQIDISATKVAADSLSTVYTSIGKDLAPDLPQSRPQTSGNSHPSAKHPTNKSSSYPVDVIRQISLLEDRKALLNRERSNLEKKIEMLRERRARREDMEARRAGPGLNK